jgi:hypothetical protein
MDNFVSRTVFLTKDFMTVGRRKKKKKRKKGRGVRERRQNKIEERKKVHLGNEGNIACKGSGLTTWSLSCGWPSSI